MLRGIRILSAMLLVTMALQVQAAETRRENFSDWGFICSKADDQENAKESCNLFQTALLNAQQEDGQAQGGQRVLLTRVAYLEGTDKPLLLITAPLGILLPAGIVIEVEGHDAVRLPLQRCDAGGCLAYVAMDEPFIAALRKALDAKVTFHDAQRRAIGIPLSLKGFTKGMEALAASRDN